MTTCLHSLMCPQGAEVGAALGCSEVSKWTPGWREIGEQLVMDSRGTGNGQS